MDPIELTELPEWLLPYLEKETPSIFTFFKKSDKDFTDEQYVELRQNFLFQRIPNCWQGKLWAVEVRVFRTGDSFLNSEYQHNIYATTLKWQRGSRKT